MSPESRVHPWRVAEEGAQECWLRPRILFKFPLRYLSQRWPKGWTVRALWAPPRPSCGNKGLMTPTAGHAANSYHPSRSIPRVWPTCNDQSTRGSKAQPYSLNSGQP